MERSGRPTCPKCPTSPFPQPQSIQSDQLYNRHRQTQPSQSILTTHSLYCYVIARLFHSAANKKHRTEIKHHHTLNEVGDIAEGRYDWKIDSDQGHVGL